MALKDTLRALRIAHSMTQEEAAEHLGVSSQTVSKWERGLLSPDISLLPKLAVLYHCSIDRLFDMDAVWGEVHHRAFREKLHALYEKADYIGVWNAWMTEIELAPDHFEYYPDAMLVALRRHLLTRERVQKLLALAKRAELSCHDDNIRNEIYRVMLDVCAEAEDECFREEAMYYYRKLPSIRHSREIYAPAVLAGEKLLTQTKINLIYTIDIAECSIRRFVTPDMPAREKIYYHEKAAALYELVLDDAYGGFYDIPLLSNYARLAELHLLCREPDRADAYMERFVRVVERHLTEGQDTSRILWSPQPPNTTPCHRMCQIQLDAVLAKQTLAAYHPAIADLRARHAAHFAGKGAAAPQ